MPDIADLTGRQDRWGQAAQASSVNMRVFMRASVGLIHKAARGYRYTTPISILSPQALQSSGLPPYLFVNLVKVKRTPVHQREEGYSSNWKPARRGLK